MSTITANDTRISLALDIVGDLKLNGTLLKNISEENMALLKKNEKMIVSVMLTSMAVVGTLGNALAIYVFARLKQKRTSTFLLLVLTCTDFITCLITIPFTITMEQLQFAVDSEVLCKAYYFLITTTVPFSCVVIVAIAIDRYLCICQPFQNWLTIRRARFLVLTLGVGTVIIGSIVAAHYTTLELMIPNNLTTLTPESEEGGRREGVASQFNSTHILRNDSVPLVEIKELQFAFSDLRLFLRSGYSLTKIFYKHLFALNQTDPSRTSFRIKGHGYKEGSSTKGSTLRKRQTAKVIPETSDRIFSSMCVVDTGKIDEKFYRNFNKAYHSIYFVSCIIVLTLYSLIFRSVIAQRKRKLCCLPMAWCLSWKAENFEVEPTTDLKNNFTLSPLSRKNSNSVRKNSTFTQEDSLACKIYVKTAGMVFVVTIIFMIAFLPAWLMISQVLEFNIILFYMYFIYNVANPFIYAFRDQSFKVELKRIFHLRDVMWLSQLERRTAVWEARSF